MLCTFPLDRAQFPRMMGKDGIKILAEDLGRNNFEILYKSAKSGEKNCGGEWKILILLFRLGGSYSCILGFQRGWWLPQPAVVSSRQCWQLQWRVRKMRPTKYQSNIPLPPLRTNQSENRAKWMLSPSKENAKIPQVGTQIFPIESVKMFFLKKI